MLSSLMADDATPRRSQYDRRIRSALVIALALAAAFPAQAAAADGLRAGAGRADITPPTGYPMLGWARGDARALGQHTRLFARALVLERGEQRLALVAADLNMVAGGMVVQAARRAGFDPRQVIVSASHTHAGPTGFSNFLFKDAAFPTSALPRSGVDKPDPLLYTFMVKRIALALTRARADLAPAAAGWSSTRLVGVTANRSLEAHLADHGIELARGQGRPTDDPDGAAHTIDPNVDVLRVDRLAGGRRVPLGAWSTFANHGTVNHSTFGYYNADHHGSADRIFEAAVRRAGHVPRRRPVVNVYGNSDAGDVSAGLTQFGPAHAEEVGRREAIAMLAAWRQAGRRLSRSPRLESRWTRVCFCGQQTAFGQLADHAVFGAAYLTGSEEGRGPLFDATGDIYEGRRLAAPSGVQGVKDQARSDDSRTLEPTSVPLTAVRLGDRLIVTIPGEATSELGRRTRAAALAAARGSGIRRVVIAGYANEYASYFTTPEEYGAQHYEGGTTVYGPASGPFLTSSLADLAARLVHGRSAPAPHPFDPIRGLRPSAPAYPAGAAHPRVLAQPRGTARLGHAVFRWRGGGSGTDRPLDRAFVTVQRLAGGRWRRADDDLGLRILWRVDDHPPKFDGIPRFRPGEKGDYTAQWEPALSAPTGRYRFAITANRYRLVSRPFRLRPAHDLAIVTSGPAGTVTLRLAYPVAVPERDFTARPRYAGSGRVVVLVGGRKVSARIRRGSATIHSPTPLVVKRARDRFGNTS
jgi:neutral ceramidase